MHDTKWQMISINESNYGDIPYKLSTIELPLIFFMAVTQQRIPRHLYESCVFFKNGSNDVVSQYATLSEAVRGHFTFAKEYNLTELTIKDE